KVRISTCRKKLLNFLRMMKGNRPEQSEVMSCRSQFHLGLVRQVLDVRTLVRQQSDGFGPSRFYRINDSAFVFLVRKINLCALAEKYLHKLICAVFRCQHQSGLSCIVGEIYIRAFLQEQLRNL